MNTLPSIGLSLLTGICLSLSSCGNNSSGTDQSKTDSSTTVTTTDSSTHATASTVNTTPQNMLIIMHKVANYEKWKMSYDSHDSVRLALGIHNYVIGRGVKDSNMVMVVMKVDDTAKAMAFEKDPGLKKRMEKGGVIGTPTMELVTALYQDTAQLESKLRSFLTITVKDWNTWLKLFQQGEQERTSNGLAVRTYGHDASNPNKVAVATALVDSAKAMAYFQSDLLKKRMDSSGVTGKPERFLYRIAQKY